MIGCECATCRSDDPRDRRLRPSLLIRAADGTSLLVDAGPDLRAQALTHAITRVDAIIFTHGHADHILGLDDVRRYNSLMKRPMRLYGDKVTLHEIKQMFGYAFDPDTPKGGGIPQLELIEVQGPITVGPLHVVPVPIWHGKRLILGLRLGRFAYLTDCSAIPDESWAPARGRGGRRPRRAAPQAAFDALFAGPGSRRVAADRGGADLFHAHVPRPAARRHERATAPGHGSGVRWAAADHRGVVRGPLAGPPSPFGLRLRRGYGGQVGAAG